MCRVCRRTGQHRAARDAPRGGLAQRGAGGPGNRPSRIRWRPCPRACRGGQRPAGRARGGMHHRGPDVAPPGIQHPVVLRRLPPGVPGARAAAIQLQQPLGRVPQVRGVRQHHRCGHGPGRAGSPQVAQGGGHRAVEQPRLCPRAGRASGPGPRLWDTRRCALRPACAGTRGADLEWGAGTQLRRAARVLRMAGAPQIQDAYPGVPQPLAEPPPLPGVRRQPAAARGPGHARRRAQPGRRVVYENRRRSRLLPRPGAGPVSPGGGPGSPPANPRPAGIPGGRGVGLLDPGPHPADPQRGRVAAGGPDLGPGLQPGEYALCAG